MAGLVTHLLASGPIFHTYLGIIKKTTKHMILSKTNSFTKGVAVRATDVRPGPFEPQRSQDSLMFHDFCDFAINKHEQI